jgi:hypothetical protein
MQAKASSQNRICALGSFKFMAFVLALFCAGLTYASSSASTNDQPKSEPKFATGERNFYEVLEDLLGDFEFDIKNGQIAGLKDVSLRNIALSENIPPSFKSHLELVITEKILKNSRTKVIQCLPCRAKRTMLNGDQVVITSPETNPAELSRIAKLSGIEHFVDATFTYQPTGMVLSMFITHAESGAIVWSRSYNSETSRASAYRRGVDFSQVDDARRMTEYQPMVQYRLTSYYLFEKNVTGTTGCLGLGLRMVERYDNRHKEVGFELDYLKDASSLVNSTASSTDNLYNGINLTLLFMHSWNLIGNEENYNLVRGNVFVGIGGTYTSGFLGGLIRTGYEWRLAKHWAVSTVLGYRPKSTAFLGTSAGQAVSGPEFGLGINYLF